MGVGFFFNGSLANIEAQKAGYAFPGQRSACYSADLLLRQYKRIRDEKKKKFSYFEIKEVYTIIFIEKSAGEFRKFPDSYLHYFEQRSDTGLKLDLLQKYLFIPLDIFGRNIQNRGINSEIDAWLAFLSQDDPDVILRLISTYPEFRPMYEDVYQLCRNVERVMGMFSEELRILDRNTVQYMIDEQQVTIDEQQATIDEQQAAIDTMQTAMDKQQARLAEERQLRQSAEEENERLRKLVAELQKNERADC